jgi:hypothetical protein
VKIYNKGWLYPGITSQNETEKYEVEVKVKLQAS